MKTAIEKLEHSIIIIEDAYTPGIARDKSKPLREVKQDYAEKLYAFGQILQHCVELWDQDKAYRPGIGFIMDLCRLEIDSANGEA